MLMLTRNPKIQHALRADTTLLLKFIDEVLRFESPVAGLYRRVKQDTVLGGVAIPAGAMVNCRLNSGNRDAERFENPVKFDLARKGIRNHLAFRAGIHFCVGISLARAELTIGWETLLSRLDNFQLQTPDLEIRYQEKLAVRTPLSVPITYETRD